MLCLILLAGCDGCASDEQRVQSATPATESTSGSTGGERSAEGAAEPGPPPEVAVRAEVDRYGRLTLAVENRGREPARLAPEVAAAQGPTLALTVGCDEEPPECVTLAPGAVLYPCECGGCDELRGTFRFAVRSCTGDHRIEGDPVEVGLR